jgi:hypothetical protein
MEYKKFVKDIKSLKIFYDNLISESEKYSIVLKKVNLLQKE